MDPVPEQSLPEALALIVMLENLATVLAMPADLSCGGSRRFGSQVALVLHKVRTLCCARLLQMRVPMQTQMQVQTLTDVIVVTSCHAKHNVDQ